MSEVYEYYLLGNTVPVRVVLSDKGLKLGAETPDAARGALIYKNTLLSRIETSPDIEEITESDFLRLCEEQGCSVD